MTHAFKGPRFICMASTMTLIAFEVRLKIRNGEMNGKLVQIFCMTALFSRVLL